MRRSKPFKICKHVTYFIHDAVKQITQYGVRYITHSMMADRFADKCWDEVEDRESNHDSDTNTEDEAQVFHGLMHVSNFIKWRVAVLPMQIHVPKTTKMPL